MSAIAFPHIGYATDEGTILRWLKAVGERVSAGEPLLEIASEKAIGIVPAESAGVLLAVYAEAGAIVAMGEPIGWLGQPGEQPPALACRLRGWAEEIAPAPPDLAARLVSPAPAPASPGLPAPAKAEPRVRAYLRGQIQRVTGQRMAFSWQAPKVDLFADIEFSAVLAHRNALKAHGAEPPSFNVYIAHAVALAYADHPELNCHWRDGRREPLDQVHVGVAVALGNDLVTVSMKNLAGVALAEIQHRFKALIRKAVTMTLARDELYGSSLTVTNLGEFEITGFTAVLNPPEIFILAIGRLEERAVVREGQIVARPISTFCLSFDHRAVDGAPASRFLRRIKHHLEHYGAGG
ncbi:MAG: 2-oxo acid dehydrogenase subunit E2 [Candidatus Lambdaproteobacteria bacterium]|nr:2-oxo acid dehydrogenase subunit E2 [Candidatus Lambdaproteobacteria bacterium]